jgi:hypothetical protein
VGASAHSTLARRDWVPTPARLHQKNEIVLLAHRKIWYILIGLKSRVDIVGWVLMKLLLRLIYIWLKKLTGVIYTNKPPSAIYYGFADLSKRQNHILKQVPNSLSRAKFDSVLDASGKLGDRLVLELFEQKRAQKKDISWSIADRIRQINGVKLDTTATIDSQFVKIPERHVKELLLQIDSLSEQ